MDKCIYIYPCFKSGISRRGQLSSCPNVHSPPLPSPSSTEQLHFESRVDRPPTVRAFCLLHALLTLFNFFLLSFFRIHLCLRAAPLSTYLSVPSIILTNMQRPRLLSVNQKELEMLLSLPSK